MSYEGNSLIGHRMSSIDREQSEILLATPGPIQIRRI